MKRYFISLSLAFLLLPATHGFCALVLQPTDTSLAPIKGTWNLGAAYGMTMSLENVDNEYASNPPVHYNTMFSFTKQFISLQASYGLTDFMRLGLQGSLRPWKFSGNDSDYSDPYYYADASYSADFSSMSFGPLIEFVFPIWRRQLFYAGVSPQYFTLTSGQFDVTIDHSLYGQGTARNKLEGSTVGVQLYTGYENILTENFGFTAGVGYTEAKITDIASIDIDLGGFSFWVGAKVYLR